MRRSRPTSRQRAICHPPDRSTDRPIHRYQRICTSVDLLGPNRPPAWVPGHIAAIHTEAQATADLLNSGEQPPSHQEIGVSVFRSIGAHAAEALALANTPGAQSG